MSAVGQAGEQAAEHPSWLLPHNRRLRNLRALMFRNVVLGPPTHSKDDHDILSRKKTSSLTVANHSLFLSKSTGNLADPTLKGRRVVSRSIPQQSSSVYGLGATAYPSPYSRHRTYTDWHLVDSFFSLHVEGKEVPIYISEIVERTTNPNFLPFDLTRLGSAVSRMDRLTVKLWGRARERFQHVMTINISLDALSFIGTPDSISQIPCVGPQPVNVPLLQLSDGIYSIGPVSAVEQAEHGLTTGGTATPVVSSTSTYDQLYQLQLLDQCFHDIQVTKQELVTKVEQSRPAQTTTDVKEAKHRLSVLENAIKAERSQVEALKQRRDELIVKNAIERTRVERKRAGLDQRVQKFEEPEKQETVSIMQELAEASELKIIQERQRLIRELKSIFPIEDVPDKSAMMSIRGLTLPKTGSLFDIDSHTERDRDTLTQFAAALGYVGQAVRCVSKYFDIPLPYPVLVEQGASMVLDGISLLPPAQGPGSFLLQQAEAEAIAEPFTASAGSAARTPVAARMSVMYPFRGARTEEFAQSFSPSAPLLHPLNPAAVSQRSRVEYGVFLLNKNIQMLASRFGCPVTDVKQTLPNLRALLHAAASGKDSRTARILGGGRR